MPFGLWQWGYCHLQCQLEPWWDVGQASVNNRVLVHCPAAAWVSVDIHDLCCHQRPHGCPATGLPAVTRWVAEGCATFGPNILEVHLLPLGYHSVLLGELQAKPLIWLHSLVIVHPGLRKWEWRLHMQSHKIILKKSYALSKSDIFKSLIQNVSKLYLIWNA